MEANNDRNLSESQLSKMNNKSINNKYEINECSTRKNDFQESFSSTSSLIMSAKRNQISFMQDSSDLLWFMEEGYQRSSEYRGSLTTPRSVFESSLLLSSDSNYSTPASSANYEAISRNIDANLAEMDMETFRTEDINTLLARPTVFSSNTSSVRQPGGDEYASVSDSLLREIELESQSIRDESSAGELSVYVEDEPLFPTSKPGSVASPLRHIEKRHTPNDVNSPDKRGIGISVDSLDMSSLEEDTNELVMRCTEQDKAKYTIAFEESLSSVIDSNLHDDKKRSQCKNISNCGLVKSEYIYTTWGRLGKDDQENCNSRRAVTSYRDKQSRSLPNILQIALLKPRCFVPLYDLHSNHSSHSQSSNSAYSSPRSLIKLFIQNRVSPSSSAQISSSLSFGSQSQESAGGSLSSASSPSTGKPPNSVGSLGLHVIQESNNNNMRLDNGNIERETTKYNEDDNVFEDSLVMDGATLLEPPKASLNRLKQTSPIKEEEEPLSDSSNADVTMTSQSDEAMFTNKGGEQIMSTQNRNGIMNRTGTRRSSSMDRFISTQAMTTPLIRQTLSANSFGNINCGVNLIGKPISTSRDGSPSSSGYMSSRQTSLEWLKRTQSIPLKAAKSNYHTNLATTRSAGTQVPVHIQDKQVQTCMGCENSNTFTVKDNGATRSRENIQKHTDDAKTKEKQSFYVCYPNYSLPDLSFLKEINEENGKKENLKQIFLSPTKHVLPPRETPVFRQGTKKGGRPKSFTDYEILTKQNLNHIKDWDSLNFLLPNEFKSLINKINTMNNDNSSQAQEPEKNIKIPKPPVVKLRSQKLPVHRRSSLEIDERQCNCGINKTSKRHSLQEPFSHIESTSNTCGENINSTMTRSSTMPTCCHYLQWHYPRYHCCHHCCHPTYAAPAHCMSPVGSRLHGTSVDVDPTIDKLSQMLSMDMSVRQVTRIVRGYASEGSSPTKMPCQTIAEQIEDFESGSFRDKDESSENSFRELKKHWEAIAGSPKDPVSGVYFTEKKITKRKVKTPDSEKKQIPTCKMRTKPQIPVKPPVIKKCLKNPQVIQRPTSLNNYHFKSLIPVPKGAKSPPAKLGSPTNGSFKQQAVRH